MVKEGVNEYGLEGTPGPTGTPPGNVGGPSGAPTVGTQGSGKTATCVIGPISNLGLNLASIATGRPLVKGAGGVLTLGPKAGTVSSSSVLLVAGAALVLIVVFGLGKRG